jgi:hypothetical protein
MLSLLVGPEAYFTFLDGEHHTYMYYVFSACTFLITKACNLSLTLFLEKKEMLRKKNSPLILISHLKETLKHYATFSRRISFSVTRRLVKKIAQFCQKIAQFFQTNRPILSKKSPKCTSHSG